MLISLFSGKSFVNLYLDNHQNTLSELLTFYKSCKSLYNNVRNKQSIYRICESKNKSKQSNSFADFLFLVKLD